MSTRKLNLIERLNQEIRDLDDKAHFKIKMNGEGGKFARFEMKMKDLKPLMEQGMNPGILIYSQMSKQIGKIRDYELKVLKK